MRHAKIIGYIVGCVGLLTVGAALAKEPAQTAGPALSTPAGCTDSMRGRTHVLRFCGDKHYWIKVAVPDPFAPGNGYLFTFGDGGVVQQGPAQNWGGPQR